MSLKVNFIPTILCKTLTDFREKLEIVEPLSEVVQIDIADGLAVPNRTLLIEDVLGVKTNLRLILHLMVKDPARVVLKTEFPPQVQEIIFHLDFDEHPYETITAIREKGINASVALSPLMEGAHTIKDLEKYLDLLHSVVFLPIIPGFGGQPLRMGALTEVARVHKLYPKLSLAIDGGITPKTVSWCLQAGVRTFYVNSFIVRSKDPKEALAELKASALE